MPKEKSQSNFAKVNRFLDALEQSHLLSETDADEFLKGIGLDPMQIASDGAGRVRKMLSKQKLASAKTRREETLAEIKNWLSKNLTKLKGNTQEKLFELLNNPEYSAQLHFRKLESLPEADKTEITIELELLKILEELENADNNK